MNISPGHRASHSQDTGNLHPRYNVCSNGTLPGLRHCISRSHPSHDWHHLLSHHRTRLPAHSEIAPRSPRDRCPNAPTHPRVRHKQRRRTCRGLGCPSGDIQVIRSAHFFDFFALLLPGPLAEPAAPLSRPAYSYSSRSASSRAASRSVRTVREAVPADAMAVHTLLRI